MNAAIDNHTFQTLGLWYPPRPYTPRGKRHRQVGVAGIGKRLPCMDTWLYTMPIQGDEHVKLVGSFSLPSARFCDVRIDLVGPLPVSSGFRYCNCHRQVHPLALVTPSDITAEAVVKAFVSVWVARIGCLRQIKPIRAWNSRPFLSWLWLPSTDPLTRTAAWHHASNGIMKKLHRRLKAALMCHADEHRAETLPWSCWGFAMHGRRTWKHHQPK